MSSTASLYLALTRGDCGDVPSTLRTLADRLERDLDLIHYTIEERRSPNTRWAYGAGTTLSLSLAVGQRPQQPDTHTYCEVASD